MVIDSIIFLSLSLSVFKVEKPVEGLKDWLDAVSTARIPCALVSSLDRKSMVDALDQMGLKKYFQVSDLFEDLT